MTMCWILVEFMFDLFRTQDKYPWTSGRIINEAVKQSRTSSITSEVFFAYTEVTNSSNNSENKVGIFSGLFA